jgi:hypothetical protein
MIDFNSHHMVRDETSQRINTLIDAGIVSREGKHAPRKYLGTSYVGRACLRSVQYEYALAPKDEGAGFDGQTLRRFERGHVGEDMAIGWFKAAGFELKTQGKDGKQFGFEAAQGRFKGHCDGVVVGGPDGFAYPFLWEHKSLGSKGWSSVAKKGVAVAYPVYASQIAVYQYHLDLTGNPALFTATNADSMELYHEFVPFDPALAQRMIDRAVQVITATDAGELLPRCASSADHFECKWCPWSKRCWA